MAGTMLQALESTHATAGTFRALDLRPVRERLLDLVRAHPGLNKSTACEQLDVAWGTVSYHVGRLVASGAVAVEARGRDVLLFPADSSTNLRRSASALREPAAAEVLRVLAMRRQAGLQEMSLQLGVSRKVTRRILNGLLEAGLVANMSRGRARYMLTAHVGGRHDMAVQGPLAVEPTRASLQVPSFAV